METGRPPGKRIVRRLSRVELRSGYDPAQRLNHPGFCVSGYLKFPHIKYLDNDRPSVNLHVDSRPKSIIPGFSSWSFVVGQ
jgi:hypothetical protein